MPLSQSLLTALFCVVVVFVVLVSLWVAIRLFTAVIKAFERNNEGSSNSANQTGG